MLTVRSLAWTLVLILAAATMVSAAAATDNNTGLKVGVVDIQKVGNDAPRVKQYMEEGQVLKKSLEDTLQIRIQNLMLDENQVKELIDLRLNGKKTPQNDARIKELGDLESKLDAELKQLQSTPQPNEQQKARLKELTDVQQKSKTNGAALEKDYNDRLRSKSDEIETKIVADMREAVNKVAEAKGLNLVFDKVAVLVGGVDITDDVISKLDRKPQ